MDTTTDGKGIDNATLIATASNDWVRDLLPEPRREGERKVLWPIPSPNDTEEYSLGPGFLW